MNSEIEVTETPNWLQELEAKREKRLKAKLAHESGAGAPCLKCEDKCPGLDLHFWRKCCKICKCAKEEHEVQDDDIYGWAQFQLLGSKPNKIKTKIVLPGKKDEVELDWTPKGHKETVDKYLKTLPPEQLPVKGSQAAQDRKQLLQKQIPIHDIDPALCHELTEDELNKMNDYVTHVKQASVGVGQLVSLSSVIKGNLHKLNPSEAAIIASRYAKGVPLSEIVKLQSQSRASMLKHQNINQGLEKLNINDHNRTLPSYVPNSLNTTEFNVNPLVGNKIHDVAYPGYTRDINQTLPNAQFSTILKPGQQKTQSQSMFDPNIDEKFLQGTNFDPKSTPSHFFNQNIGKGEQTNLPYAENLAGYKSGDATGAPNSAFVPYSKMSTGFRPGDNYIEENPSTNVNYTSNIPGHGKSSPSGFRSGDSVSHPGRYRPEQNYSEGVNPQHPNYSRNLAKGLGNQNIPPGYKSGHPAGQFGLQSNTRGNEIYENVEEMKKQNPHNLPSYAPSKYNVHSEVQAPTKVPKNVRDLAFSTYDQSSIDPNEVSNTNEPSVQKNIPGQPNIPYGQYKSSDRSSPSSRSNVPNDYKGGSTPYDQTIGPNGTEYKPNDAELQLNVSGQPRGPYGRFPGDLRPGGDKTRRYDQNVGPEEIVYNPIDPEILRNISGKPNVSFGHYPTGFTPGSSGTLGDKTVDKNSPSGKLGDYPSGFRPVQPGSGHIPTYNQDGGTGYQPGQNLGPIGDSFNQYITGRPPNAPYEDYPSGPASGHNKPGKKLSELHPGKINIDEDFLQPSQVTIGAIQDINYPEIKAATHGTNDFYEDYSPDSLREILNNIILPDCHYCKKPFEENEFAITIDRANVLFHAECFKCAGCNQILADNVYFYNKETDNVYCGRDYAKIRGFPRCKACDELIFTKEYCLAENSTFHLKHFCCIECDRPLAGQDYTLEDEMPYCLPCFEQSKASKCSSCCRVIKPDEVGCNLNGIHFHASDECFACKMCKKPMMGQKLLLRNGKLYCSHDCFGADK